MMKRLIAVLLVCCALAAPALGETLRERVEAPESVTLPAVTPGEHSTLAFEARVLLPQVQKAPVLQVRIDDISEERIFAAADALGLKDINRKASAWDDDVFGDGTARTYHGYASGWRLFNAHIRRECAQEPQAVTFANLDSNEFRKAEYSGQAVPYPQAPREGTMTREKAYALAEETIRAFTQEYDYTLEVEGALRGYAQLTDGEITALNQGKKEPASVPPVPYAFSFHFAPVFAGIPVTQHDAPNSWKTKEEAELLMAQVDPEGRGLPVSFTVDPWLQVIVLDDGVHALEWRNPLSVTGVVQEDAQLLPFADILAKAREELGKYCIQSEERYDQYKACWDVVVTEIRFGYLCWQEEPGSMELRLVPVWDFMVNGNLIRDGEWVR